MFNHRKVWLVLTMILAAGCLPFPASAQGTVYGVSRGLSVQGGYVLPSDSFHDDSLMAGASFLLPFSPNITLEVGGEFSSIRVHSQPGGLSQGRLLHIPVLVGLRLRYPLRNFPLVPVLIVGVGYALNVFSLDKDALETYQSLGFEIDETCRSAPLAQFGAGLEIVLTPRITLDVRGLYRLSRTSSRWSITDEVTGNTSSGTVEAVSLNALQVVTGIRFSFM